MRVIIIDDHELFAEAIQLASASRRSLPGATSAIGPPRNFGGIAFCVRG